MKIPTGKVFQDFDTKTLRRFRIDNPADAPRYCEPGKFCLFWNYDAEEYQLGKIEKLEDRPVPRGVWMISGVGYRFVEWNNVHYGFVNRGEKIDTASAKAIMDFVAPLFQSVNGEVASIRARAEAINKRMIIQEGANSEDSIHDYYFIYDDFRAQFSVKNEGFQPEIIIHVTGIKRARHIPFVPGVSGAEEIQKAIHKYLNMISRQIRKDKKKFAEEQRAIKKLAREQRKNERESRAALKAQGRLRRVGRSRKSSKPAETSSVASVTEITAGKIVLYSKDGQWMAVFPDGKKITRKHSEMKKWPFYNMVNDLRKSSKSPFKFLMDDSFNKK